MCLALLPITMLIISLLLSMYLSYIAGYWIPKKAGNPAGRISGATLILYLWKYLYCLALPVISRSISHFNMVIFICLIGTVLSMANIFTHSMYRVFISFRVCKVKKQFFAINLIKLNKY